MSKDIILSASTVVAEKTLVKVLLKNLQERMKEDPKFKWVLLGGSIYLTARVLNFDTLNFWPVSSVFDWFYNKITVPESCIMWGGEIEPDIHFGRLGYTRCLESDPHVLEKYGVPMNSEKCIRSGISYIPGEKYQQFDLNEFDSKVTPMTWTYGPITDPTFITPTCWYNDMSGENREFELFQRSMRIFGYLPPEAYQQLYQHCKVMLLRTNQHLIRIGDPDDKMYIIVSGAVDVYSNGVGAHGDFIRLRTAMHGGQIMSLFSIIDCITGNAKNIKSISAISKLNSTKVLIFPIAAFKEYLVKHQEYMVASIIRLMERSYRLQYQILHLAWHLTSTVTSLNTEPIYDLPNILLPPPGQELSERIKNKALQSFMEFFGIDDIEFLKEHCEIDVVEPEEPTNDLVEIKSTLLNKASVGYKYLYIGKLEGFHLKSNLNIMDQQARRKFVEEEIITEPLFHVLPREGVGSLTGILGYSNTLFCRATERSIVVTLSRHGLES
ncbi:unnamed protein product [Orchesella dallaii]|uniref:Cyclic nucleotide-binding domain-containing protein n=1 Tax=Orchesella dallaii TaxID=48710 RepID=A0ABP1QU01_9HEXA